MYSDERYLHDPEFKALVDTLYMTIKRGKYTPTEIREAAMLAQIHYEQTNPRPIMVSPHLLEMLKGNK